MTAPGAAEMKVRCLQHPAQGGIVPRLMFAPKTRASLRRVIDRLNTGHDPAHLLQGLPGLQDCVKIKDGKAQMRSLALPRLYPVTLHHKLAVFDGKITYVGGLDLNERRYDDHDHEQPAQDTWHDVQLVVTHSAIAKDARTYLRTLPPVIRGDIPAPRVQSPFLTTLSRQRPRNTFRLAPQPVSSMLFKAHLAQIRRARNFIYLETQFFRDRRIAKALARAGRRNPGLKLLLLVPAAPEDVAFSDSAGLDGRFGEFLQARAIRQVRRAFGSRFLVVSPAQRRTADQRDTNTARATLAGAPIIYVHAKLSLFDDQAAIVSSANLNGRSMKWDAEAGVLLTAPDQVRDIRRKVFDYWLAGPAEQSFINPESAFDAWAALAKTNAASAPDERRGFLVPYATKPAARVGVPIPGAPEEIV
jgi:phospholipase D1/2